MKKNEIIGFLIILLLSTGYSFVKPEGTVEKLKPEVKIELLIEGKCNQTLSFNHVPTVGDVFEQLEIDNTYGFNELTVLDNQTVFYIPKNDNLISLNQATKEQLMTIIGIGPKTADKIIAYRAKTPFNTIEEIKNISGIGDKTYLRLRELVCL